MVLGDDGGTLRRAAAGLAGLVVAGFGVGHVPAATVAVLTSLAAAMPVVLASRIGVGALEPFKARVLLHLLLAGGASRSRVAAVFAAGYA